MRLQDFLNEEDDILTDEEKAKKVKSEKTRKQSRQTLKNNLRKLEDQMDKFIDDIENEIDKIEDNPSFQYKLGQMLANINKEEGEYQLALRQIVQTLGKKASVIPQVRGHIKDVIPDEDSLEEYDNEDDEDSKYIDRVKKVK